MNCPSDSECKSSCSPTNPNFVNHIPPNPFILSQLNDTRAKSTIPSKQSCWLYPSHRQFYKSTLSKGHDVDAKLIPTIVEIHNLINEKAWEHVMEYESLHKSSCTNPVLIHFVGRKDKPTIKSILNAIIGYKRPYDRHDWTVDRCGKRRRYILDFYEGFSENPDKMGVHIDVRPDLSFDGICDRLRLWVHKSFGGA
ncbi:cytochrome C1 heme lyase [Theileria orientalis]|uniref:Holocytochrome c-type synthase n=1 Tax=Theileria orientalis TaxID=68886 RepID=A0A976SII7_THEOR|nr:cytochrome C1 heme lyase [Theileria orientalis]